MRHAGRRRHRYGSEGFSLIEVLVALMVLSIVMVAGGAVLGIQMASMENAKGDLGAEGILTNALSEVRAMPYAKVAAGVGSTMSSPLVTKAGTTWTFVDHSPKLAGKGNGEQIPHSSASAAKPPAPFYPDPTTQVIGGTHFTVVAVPTLYTTPPSTPHGSPVVVPGVIRVTVVVSWSTHLGTTSSATLIGQTLVYSSGTGCLSGVSNPFAAPCRPNSVSSVALSAGRIIIRPGAAALSAATDPVQGVKFTTITLNLPSTNIYDDFLQTSSVSGWASTTGVSITSGGTALSKTLRVSTAASNDPALSSGQYQHNSGTSTLTGLSVTGRNTATAINSITATPSPGDTGNSVSAVSTSSSQTCVNETTGVATTVPPCGVDTATQVATASITAALNAGVTSLGPPVPLVRVAKPTSNAVEAASSTVPQGTGSCQTTATSVCVVSGGQVTLGTTSFDALPSAMSGVFPAGWNATYNLVSLSHYSASVSSSIYGDKTTHKGSHAASIGSGSTVPVITMWTGTGYTSKKLSTISGTYALPTFVLTDPTFSGGALTVTISATVNVTLPSVSTQTHAGCATACSYSATVPSVTINSTYEITQGSSMIADLDITAGLGSASTSSSYQAAS
jgi:prepilin-type N-terminal cleavage/methylation domain-containing protein